MPQSRKRWRFKLHPRDKHKSYDIDVAGRRGLLDFLCKYVTHFRVHFACNLNTLKDRIAKQDNTKQATYRRKVKKKNENEGGSEANKLNEKRRKKAKGRQKNQSSKEKKKNEKTE